MCIKQILNPFLSSHQMMNIGTHSSNKTRLLSKHIHGHFDERVGPKLLVVVCGQHTALTSVCVTFIYGEIWSKVFANQSLITQTKNWKKAYKGKFTPFPIKNFNFLMYTSYRDVRNSAEQWGAFPASAVISSLIHLGCRFMSSASSPNLI